jgi:hypothetical protein
LTVSTYAKRRNEHGLRARFILVAQGIEQWFPKPIFEDQTDPDIGHKIFCIARKFAPLGESGATSNTSRFATVLEECCVEAVLVSPREGPSITGLGVANERAGGD